MEVQVSKRLPSTRISIEKVKFLNFPELVEWDMWLYIDRFPPQLITTYKRKRDAVRGATRLQNKIRMVHPLYGCNWILDVYLEGKYIA